jgi:diaminohydroxyphosphoribosylaminopyrimidine deaminase/5-amino-6-(5-phosphoribosylamino)uracil reductase
MQQALALARLALGQSSPNPAVGAVIVKNDSIVGQGYTQPPGSPHAEIMALKQAGEAARGAVLYVTLEPCCHYGRTAPCTKAIIEAGIREVHLAMIDPNPLVSGEGVRELQNHGLAVYTGEHALEAGEVNEAFCKFITTQRPFVTAKFAISLDGKIATRNGDSRWISGIESRRMVHQLRYISDAVMVGAHTILADDARLTVRCCGGKGGMVKKQPLRVVLDSRLETPSQARVLHEPGRTIIATLKSADRTKKQILETAGAEILELDGEIGQVDLEQVMSALGQREITSVLVEGGGVLLGSLFDQRAVDKVIVFIAPLILGGTEAKSAVAGRGVAQVSEALRLKRVKVENIGEDTVISGYTREQTCLPV